MSRPQSAASSLSHLSSSNRKPLQKSTSLARPSLASLFVTNLRLLDLDKLIDWPHITQATLSVGESQKTRIRCVEWALYRLFELWDPVETKEKLLPFFPPLEPLQSINLRAALFRALNELKKNGVLGRNSIVRKTMLDECKGEKFEEILVLISTAVLRKGLAKGGSEVRARKGNKSNSSLSSPIVRRLATAPRFSEVEKKSLLPLAIAHKASLQSALKRKETQRKRYLAFESRLRDEEAQISKRHQLAKHSTQEDQGKTLDYKRIEKTVREHWLTSTEWADTLLHGDTEQSSDNFFAQSFDDELWPQINSGTSKEQYQQRGLLEDLEHRVKEQQVRLRKWEQFRTESNSKNRPLPSSDLENVIETHRANPVLAFNRHEHLQLGKGISQSPTKLTHPLQASLDLRSAMPSRYRKLLLNMHDDLAKASRTTSSAKSEPNPGQHLDTQGATSSISRQPLPPSEAKHDSAIDNPSAPPEVNIKERVAGPVSTPLSPITITDEEDEKRDLVTRRFPISPIRSRSPPPSSPPIPEDPSKLKQSQLSLAERTRKSMAIATGSSDDLPMSSPLPPASSPDLPVHPPSQPNDRRASLLDRTRQSMAGISSLTHVPNLKIGPRKKSSRQSQFPVNQFETPQKQHRYYSYDEADGTLPEDDETEAKELTPKEDLFSDDAAYASVFKSRPRVALSPGISPREERRVVSPLEAFGG
ncbi:MAG: hypothetical protein M1820_010796 [Bogoriella megaspora]|nr:MAG: hypothetical protein M1820_010796 [Bogoriella megaspora]